MVELHQEGYAPTAGAAGLFIQKIKRIIYIHTYSSQFINKKILFSWSYLNDLNFKKKVFFQDSEAPYEPKKMFLDYIKKIPNNE